MVSLVKQVGLRIMMPLMYTTVYFLRASQIHFANLIIGLQQAKAPTVKLRLALIPIITQSGVSLRLIPTLLNSSLLSISPPLIART